LVYTIAISGFDGATPATTLRLRIASQCFAQNDKERKGRVG
jgi:hypothetical protein